MSASVAARVVERLRVKVAAVRQVWFFDNHWSILATRIPPRRAVTTYRTGALRIVVDHSAGDATGIRDVFATPMYRNLIAELDLPRRLRVVDVGAHIGSFTLLLASLGFEFEAVTCVEMNPSTFARLHHNITTNITTGITTGIDAVRLVHAALNGDGRDVAVELGRGGTGDSIEHGSLEASATTEHLVEGITFDALVGDCEHPIDICKLDVEGAEYDVFAHPHCALIRRCRYLVIEIHDRDGTAPADLVGQLESLGFVSLARPPTAVGVHALRHRSFT